MMDHSEISEQASSYFHGEALACDPWASRYGSWVVLGFTACYTIFLIGMNVGGQVPGKSFLLKSTSDILQFVGEGIGCLFCIRIATRLRTVFARLRRKLIAKEVGREVSNDLQADRAETQAAHRAYLAWTLLAIAIALYATGQAVWTSYDVRMNSADVPFPGLYDLGFVASYAFFLIGTLLLTRRSKAAVRRAYLLLDVLAVIGASLALSWFFLLAPSIAGLTQAPSSGAAFLSICFPTGDLFLVAVGAFLMFSPLSDRAQQPVFMLLCLGLFFLAITDSLLGYYNLAGGFNTGTLQDVLWPTSMQLIGVAAITYPDSIAREQQQREDMKNTGTHIPTLPAASRGSQFTAIALTLLPLLLVLLTCGLLLLRITPQGGAISIQSDFVVLALVLLLVARQTLTLLENNRLITQIQNELALSRRELLRKHHEAEEANRQTQERLELEEGIAALRAVHTRVVRGDFTARVPAISGPLQQIAISLNMILEQLSSTTSQSARYKQLTHEFQMVQDAIKRFEQGLPPWSSSQPPLQSTAELQAIFHGLLHQYSHQRNQWHSLGSSLESAHKMAQHVRESLSKIRRSHPVASPAPSAGDNLNIALALKEVEALEQQQQQVLNRVTQSISRFTPSPSLGDTGKHDRVVK
ncbi:MAG TPA: hypothetical protein VKR06_07895 [Ktedonosporobacter sp.]|nr:hypothetical protein [Ktedonosporobacter sp.]